MSRIKLNQIAPPARFAWAALRDELQSILADDLVAMWAFGGTTSVVDPAHAGDLDTYIVLRGQPDETAARRIEEAESRIARKHGVEWDNWYIGADDARAADPPRHAWHKERRDTSWALNRSHWLAGRYVLLQGTAPDAIVARPSWDEIESELSRELEHIERHVVEGDTDAFEATYGILNGSRILHALETHSAAISKRAAGSWALDHLPARWHPAISAAIASYEGRATDDGVALLAIEMEPFVAFVRERLSYADDRPPDATPRWSGS